LPRSALAFLYIPTSSNQHPTTASSTSFPTSNIMSLIDTSFDDATIAPAQVPSKVAPLIPSASGSQPQKTEDILNDFSTESPPSVSPLAGKDLDDLMSFSPVVGKKVTA
jgi:hypothetical protein